MKKIVVPSTLFGMRFEEWGTTMARSFPSWLLRYGLAVLSIAVAVWLRLLLDPFFGEQYPFGFAYVALLFVAWYDGWGPSLLAFFLGFLATSYFFIPPRYTFSVFEGHHLVGLLIYSLVGLASIIFGETLQSARKRAEASAQQAEQQRQRLEEEVHERKRLEKQLRQHAHELAEADRRKDEFLAMLAHELRNPLAPVQNGLRIMDQLAGINGTALEKVRGMMERQVQHLSRLVDDLLDISRITRGKIQLRRTEVDLNKVLEEVVDACSSIIEKRHQEFAFWPPDEVIYLHADPTRLEQIITNLLANASKYTKEGGHIWLSAERDGDTAVLTVRDDGRGIEPEMLEHIFEPFAQLVQTSDDNRSGLGIGLALVKRLAELHGGSVRAVSAGQDQGSEFVVRLPALTEQEFAEYLQRQRALRPHVAPHAKRRVLVVDDNIDAAKTLAMLLRLEGHEVCIAKNGPIALQKARAEHPDIILLDIEMPGMNGYEVAHQLRQQPEMNGALLVALTGYGQEEALQRSRDAGFDDHIVKPTQPEDLTKVFTHPKLAAR